MEPITASLTAAKEIYEAAKTIQKVYNVSKEMKTVAESEGKDQIMATKDLAETASKMQQEGTDGKEGKSESSNKELKIEDDLYRGDGNNPDLLEGAFVHELDSSNIKEETISESVGFVDKLPNGESIEKTELKDVFVERLSSPDNQIGEASIENETNRLKAESGNEVVEQTSNNTADVIDSTNEAKAEGLTDQEKQEIKEKTGWSDKIVDAIRSKEEAQIYIDAGLVEGDDNGKPYIKDGELIPNNTYEINGVKYETDDKGRIVRAEAKVEINNSPRPSLNNRKVGGLEPGDDKGHVIAHVLGGSDTEGNLVAQDAKLNRGEYKSMELSAKRAREEGKDVTMTVEIEYDGDSKRPKSFTVTLEIDGDITVKKFINNSNG